MPDQSITRKLTAILYADVAGYSRLTGSDEVGTHRQLSANLDLIAERVESAGGRVVHYAGDAVLAEFVSVVSAVETSVDIQRALAEVNADTPEDRRIRFRIGVNLGEVIVDRDDIYGDGVNIAARLESLAKPGGICISAVVYDQVKGKLELTFKSIGAQRVKNIAEPVRAFHVVLDPGITPVTKTTRPELRETPSIVVLPIRCVSHSETDEELADGLTEDLITTLSKVSGLFVIAWNTSFAYRERERNLLDVASELGVRYILNGSIRTSSNRMRISVQLVDAAHGGQVWAQRYDRTIDDVFAIQDEITLRVAIEMQVQLTEGEQARIRYVTASNFDAWSNWVQGLSHFRRNVSKDGVGRAREFWERAVTLDPDSAALNAMLGLLHWASARYGWWDDRTTALERSEAYIQLAMSIDNENADANNVLALQHLMRGRHGEAVDAAGRAIDLAPGSADIAAFTSLVFNFSGLPDEALTQITKAMRLSPIYPVWYLGDLGFANRLLGRFEEAIDAFSEYSERSPGSGHVDLVIIYVECDRDEESKAEALRLLVARPNFSVGAWRETQFYKDPARLELDVAALRAAGLPD